MSIIVFIVVLVVLILVHEFGHFIVAKRLGVRVDEFGLGFPPRLFGIKRGETVYSFNAIPFGGFVKIHGEDAESVEPDDPDSERSFINQRKWVQGAIIGAGVFFNVLLGWFLISIGFMSGLPTPVGAAPSGATIENVAVTITGVEAGSPAEAVGIIAGDKIIGLGAGNDLLEEVTIPEVQSFIILHGEEEIFLKLARGEKTLTMALLPAEGIIESRPAIGITMDMIGVVSLPPHLALWEGLQMTVLLTIAVADAFFDLIAGAFTGEADIGSLAGPVGIVGLVGSALEFGFIYLLGFTALISINLAIINLLPFPALDGGRLFFLLIETITRSPINLKFARIAHMAGFAILIILMLVITYNDIMRIL